MNVVDIMNSDMNTSIDNDMILIKCWVCRLLGVGMMKSKMCCCVGGVDISSVKMAVFDMLDGIGKN